ncbi:hypothetical protein [Magnetospirillum gryphiswaldense]|uniref:Membrane protein n=1 Tax=Magnetospirillum gryphiswaldense TaxID=55518 RepID=A4TWN7_9PROT|nr:hypothetical protein [Magnetospirillum gryphiswaldense]AVM75730.1 hypothetical protein MSR1_32650 [Magnetospirillum gryphiswaldense MSR-1]AVM79633.1 hypothetical protein MSR1L_32650 [Magnetospirillum gryphiswaldense]CAM75044.1 membrane protein [Magnetospirillum gryphiswaldense MSR-1]
MDLDAEVAVLEKKRTFLTRLGIGGMLLFLTLIVGYIYSKGGPAKVLDLPFNNMGDFLAGAFAPLAFWWLVIGYWMQSLELEHNSKALRQQAEEMRNTVEQATEQAQALRSSEALSRQSVFNQTRQRYEEDLELAAARISERITHGSLDGMWANYSSGRRYIFCEHVSRSIDVWSRNFIESEDEQRKAISNISIGYIDIFDNFMRTLFDLGAPSFWARHYNNSPYGQLREVLTEFVEGES